MAKYVYDAWGNHKVLNPDGTVNTFNNFVGNINPIRYRSYYWDSDVELYYLHTRWYDPEIGRFTLDSRKRKIEVIVLLFPGSLVVFIGTEALLTSNFFGA